ncbi:MAG TPA: HIT domain-containing protein [Candidatus Paceibacterota bacterium]
MDDIFCKIISKKLPTQIVAEGEEWLAIKDIHPQAPVHVLIISKKHVPGLEGVSSVDAEMLGHLLLAANDVALKTDLAKGFRVIINVGEDSERMTDHLHIHVLGGKKLGAKIVN